MTLILSVVIIALLTLFAGKALKKAGKALYCAAALLGLLSFCWAFGGWRDLVPESLLEPAMLLESLFLKGILGTACFIVVMWTGALKPGTKARQKFQALRAEWSVIGGFLIIPHIVVRAIHYWPPTALGPAPLFLYLDGIFCLLLLLPLWITSFLPVRRRMKGRSWQRLQKLAYPFYALIGLHGLVLHLFLTGVPYAAAFYAIVFGLYAAARLYLARSRRVKKTARAEALR